jgi:hypothetical protein
MVLKESAHNPDLYVITILHWHDLFIYLLDYNLRPTTSMVENFIHDSQNKFEENYSVYKYIISKMGVGIKFAEKKDLI